MKSILQICKQSVWLKRKHPLRSSKEIILISKLCIEITIVEMCHGLSFNKNMCPISSSHNFPL